MRGVKSKDSGLLLRTLYGYGTKSKAACVVISTILESLWWGVCSVWCVVCSMRCEVCSLQCSVQCAVCSVHYAV